MTPKAFQKDLLNWYDQFKRDLPFRKNKVPYRIWLSEIMAQQTTISAVLGYFERFVTRFPDVESVATADEEELLTYWQGLGYYSRVRNFQKACIQVMQEHAGKVPTTYAELIKLKGVGDYTAAAISSICFDEPKAVVDGNVKRVLARLHWYEEEISSTKAKTFFNEQANTLLSHAHPGDYNQALMELGALICRPKSPQCLICPVRKHCKASSKNPEAVPVKKKMKMREVTYHALLVRRGDTILLKKPHASNLIKGMWELPSLYDETLSFEAWSENLLQGLDSKKLTNLGVVKHGIMDRKITTQVHTTDSATHSLGNDYAYLQLSELESLPLNTLSRKILHKFT